MGKERRRYQLALAEAKPLPNDLPVGRMGPPLKRLPARLLCLPAVPAVVSCLTLRQGTTPSCASSSWPPTPSLAAWGRGGRGRASGSW